MRRYFATLISEKLILVPMLKTANLTQISKQPPEYRLEDVYRYVIPYHHTYRTFTKQRWAGKKIIDMFSTEFQAYDYEYYVTRNTYI